MNAVSPRHDPASENTTTSRSIAWILLAAGSSTRFGATSNRGVSRSKLLEPLGSQRVIDVTIDSCRAAVPSSLILLVSSPEFRDELALDLPWTEGGRLRQESARNGLIALDNLEGGRPDIAFIHDAARPFPSRDIVAILMEALKTVDAACPGLAVTDTIKRIAPNGRVEETLNRAALRAVQTPQAVRVEPALRAFACIPDGVEFTDDLQVMEAAGYTTAVVEGDARNIKITTPADLAAAERSLKI